MGTGMLKNGLIIGSLAFLQRAFGLHPRHQPFENLTARSKIYLDRLEGTPGSFRFETALRQLRYDWDLLEWDAANDTATLQLQLRVLELSESRPEAEDLIRPQLEKAPLGRLFSSIISQAQQDNARDVLIDFSAKPIQVTFDGREAMTIPNNLGSALSGIVRFVEAAGYSRVKHLLWKKVDVPQHLEVAWPSPDRSKLIVSAP
jgi:hypothetical protein